MPISLASNLVPLGSFKIVDFAHVGGNLSILSESVTQNAHGFVAGDVLYHNGTIFAKASNASVSTSDVIGMVLSATTNNFVMALPGSRLTGSGWTAGRYFLGSTAGSLTQTGPAAPSGIGKVNMPVLFAISSTVAYFHPKRGILIE
jgi:hypothetical protein